MRFFNYWIPYWKLNWSFTIPKTSAILLWLPGAILNTFLYSDKVLYIPILSVIHKILLFGVLILLFEWISLHAKYKNVLYLSIGIPVILVLTATDYVAYLNSFYSESASFVYLFLMIVSLLVLLQFPTTIRLLCSFVSVFLLATSHPSNMYWPLLAVPFILSAWFSNKSITLRVKLLTNLSLIGLLTILSASVVKPSSTKFNMYHSLFYGVLSFSDNPNVHLQSLEMDDAVGCINTSAFSSKVWSVWRNSKTNYHSRIHSELFTKSLSYC